VTKALNALRRAAHSLASLPIMIVAANLIFAGVVLSATEEAGWND